MKSFWDALIDFYKKLMPMNDKRDENQLGLKSLSIDLADDSSTSDPASILSATVEATPHGLTISANGYGSANSDEIALVQLYEGVLCLFVWADIDQEHPTHTIPLFAAKKKIRMGK